jgi:hypothetical protein
MVTVLRAEGLRVVIFANDHLPAIWADGMSRGDVRRALRLVTAQRLFLLKRWKDFHG